MAVQLNHPDKNSICSDLGLMLETNIYFIMVFISSLNLVFFKIFVSLLFIYCLIKIISKFCQFDFDAVIYSKKQLKIALIVFLVLFLCLASYFVSYYWIFIKNPLVFREEYANIGYLRFQTYNESLFINLQFRLNNLQVLHKYESFLYVLEFFKLCIPFILFLNCLFKIKKEVEALINGQDDDNPNEPNNSVLHGKADDSEKQTTLEPLKEETQTIKDTEENKENRVNEE